MKALRWPELNRTEESVSDGAAKLRWPALLLDCDCCSCSSGRHSQSVRGKLCCRQQREPAVMEDQYVVHSHHPGEFYSHPPQFTATTKEEQQGEHQVSWRRAEPGPEPLQCNAVVIPGSGTRPSGHQAIRPSGMKQSTVFLVLEFGDCREAL